jgi:CheY-like chemotaxis protein
VLAVERIVVEGDPAGPFPILVPGRYARLSVSDTGSGMDAATRARIFEPFFTTKGVGKGTGLGLATVYGVIKQSGGHIEVASQIGKGTTFLIYLPASEDTPPGPRALTQLADLPQGTETILVVEDEEGVRALACEVLRRCGYTVLEARQGVEALDLMGRFSATLHLLVTDVVMPQMDGRTLASLLSTQRPGLKVLFVTGYADSFVQAQGINESEAALLMKPYMPADLARKVRDLLN